MFSVSCDSHMRWMWFSVSCDSHMRWVGFGVSCDPHMLFLFQVFDSNTSSDKSFRFKIGKGKVIKVPV